MIGFLRSTVVVLFGAITVGGPVGLALATETSPVPIPATHVLAHARTTCHVDRFDELEQTTAARWSDLTDSALRCVLAAVDAPADLAGEMVDRSPGYGTKPWDTKTGRWTAAWKWGPAGLVVTIRLMPTTPS